MEAVEKQPIHKRSLVSWLNKPWKRVLFVSIIVLLLVGLGASAYWYLTTYNEGKNSVSQTQDEVIKNEEIVEKNETTSTPAPVSSPTTPSTSSTSGSATSSSAETAQTTTPTPVTPAPAFAVTLGTGTVDHSYASGCSSDFNFSFPVTSNGAGSITYKILGSPAFLVPFTTTLSFTKAETKTISYKLTTTDFVDGYRYLRVYTPTTLNSNPVNYKFDAFCL